MWEIVFCQKEICFWDTWIVSLLGNVWTTAYILYIFQFISGGKVWYFIIIRISTGYTKLLIHYSITYQLLPSNKISFFHLSDFCWKLILFVLGPKIFMVQRILGPKQIWAHIAVVIIIVVVVIIVIVVVIRAAGNLHCWPLFH